MMTDLPPLSALMEHLDFTLEELNMNRGRQMSQRQRGRLKSVQNRTLLIGGGVFLLLTFTATLLIFLGQRNQQVLLSGLGVFATVLNAISIGYSARSYFRLASDLREKEPLEIYEGILERVLRPNGQVNNYVLRLAQQEFSVTKDVFRQFRHGQVYSIYATLHANVLMSAECLSDPNA